MPRDQQIGNFSVASAFRSSVPPSIALGAAYDSGLTGGEWSGRIYSLAIGPAYVTAQIAAQIHDAQRGLTAYTAPAPGPVTDRIDGGMAGNGWHGEGGGLISIRTRIIPWSGSPYRHYMARLTGCKGQPITLSLPIESGGAGMEVIDRSGVWQGAWAYDPDGQWHDFDHIDFTGSELVMRNFEPAEQDTVFVARRPVFSNTR